MGGNKIHKGKKTMKIFVIHPVREISEQWKDGLGEYVKSLEKQGHSVYDPIRDTNQNDNTGLTICETNRKAIEDTDEVHIAWDNKSTGCLFDIGITFALKKRIKTITGYFPPINEHGKSFVKMIHAWEAEENNY